MRPSVEGMSTNYEAAWSTLPQGVRDRLGTGEPLNVAALAHAGISPTHADWVNEPASEPWLLPELFALWVADRLDAEADQVDGQPSWVARGKVPLDQRDPADDPPLPAEDQLRRAASLRARAEHLRQHGY